MKKLSLSMLMLFVLVVGFTPTTHGQTVNPDPCTNKNLMVLEWLGGSTCVPCFLEPCWCPDFNAVQLQKVTQDVGELKKDDVILGYVTTNEQKIPAINQLQNQEVKLYKVLREGKALFVPAPTTRPSVTAYQPPQLK